MNSLDVLIAEIDRLEGPDIAATLVGILPERADCLKSVLPDEWESTYSGDKSLLWCQELSKSLLLDGPGRLDGLTLPDGTTLKFVSLVETSGSPFVILESIPAPDEVIS